MIDEETTFRLNAYLDGELSPLEAATFERRLAEDAETKQAFNEMKALSGSIRSALQQDPVPARLQERLAARLPKAFIEEETSPKRRSIAASSWSKWAPLAACLVVGVCLGSLLTILTVPHLRDAGASAGDLIYAAHLRALAAPEPYDIASSDRHVVKPWFNGRTTIAPVAPDLTSAGFVLIGGRVDVIGATKVPTLVYRCRRHIISVTVTHGTDGAAPAEELRDGTTLVRWTAGSLNYVAVSDLNVVELRTFVSLFSEAVR